MTDRIIEIDATRRTLNSHAPRLRDNGTITCKCGWSAPLTSIPAAPWDVSRVFQQWVLHVSTKIVDELHIIVSVDEMECDGND